MVSGIFCEHGRVKTTCPSCKPLPAAAPVKQRAVELPSGRAPGPRPEVEDEEPSSMGARGPGKPLLAQRKRPRKASASDMANADAWFVRKR